MTFYEKELNRIRSIVYSNEGQLNTVIGIRNYIDNHYDVKLNLDLQQGYAGEITTIRARL